MSAQPTSEPPSLSERNVNKCGRQCGVPLGDASFIAHDGGGDDEGVLYINEHLCHSVMGTLNAQRQEDKSLCDVVLEVCGGRRLWAHRAVLAVGSRYLRDVIASATRAHVIGDVSGDVTDDVSGDGDVSLPQHISLPTVDAQTCACALRYMYTGHVDVSLRRVNTLIDLSVTLQMPDLATACVAHMRASVGSATWRPIVATCAQYSLWGLLKEVVVFVARRVEVCELTCLSESVFTAVLSQWSGEVEWAVTALLTWASSDYDARRAAFSTLTQTTVHLSQLPPHTLHALLTPYLSHPISQHPAVLRSGGQDEPVTARVTSSSQLTSAGSMQREASRVKLETVTGSAGSELTERGAAGSGGVGAAVGSVRGKTAALKATPYPGPHLRQHNTRKRRKAIQPQKLSEARQLTSPRRDGERKRTVTFGTQTTWWSDEEGEGWGAQESTEGRRVRDNKQVGVVYPCDRCPRTFATPSALRHHKKGHGSSTPFLCEICGFSTIHFASINVHQRQHNGKKFECPLAGCTYSSIRRSRLEDHISAHAGIKNFVCSLCGKAFAGRKHLQRHEKIHSAGGALSCGDCAYQSGRRDKLREHIRRHHPLTAVTLGYLTATAAANVVTPKGRRRGRVGGAAGDVVPAPGGVWAGQTGAALLSDDVMQYLASMTAAAGGGSLPVRDSAVGRPPLPGTASLQQLLHLPPPPGAGLPPTDTPITTDVTPPTTTQPAWLYAPQQGTAQQAQYKVFENLTPYTEPAEFNSLVNQ